MEEVYISYSQIKDKLKILQLIKIIVINMVEVLIMTKHII